MRPPANNQSKAGASEPGRLEALGGLDAAHLEAIERLERACGAVDGGRLKLEFPSLRSRPTDRIDDFCWFVGDDLVGFLGLYQVNPAEIEICGMVHPDHRRTGIFTTLLESSRQERHRRGDPTALLIVDRSCEPGVACATSYGATLLRSEYRMTQDSPPQMRPEFDSVSLRPSRPDDSGFMIECLSRAFGHDMLEGADEPSPAMLDRLARALVVESHGQAAGVMTVERDGDKAGIYGFAVVPERQGQGIGRAALSRITNDLRAEGISHAHLEVAVDNPNALGLYESCGFEMLGAEDYYLLA